MSQTIESKNKALVLKAFDTLFNKRDYVSAEHYWSPNYIQHSAHIAPGREGLFNLIKSIPSTLQFVTRQRIARAQQLIRETSRSQIEIALEVATPVRAISRRSSGGKPVLRPAITGGRSPVSSRQGQHQALHKGLIFQVFLPTTQALEN
jgi:hypothetical protein